MNNSYIYELIFKIGITSRIIEIFICPGLYLVFNRTFIILNKFGNWNCVDTISCNEKSKRICSIGMETSICELPSLNDYLSQNQDIEELVILKLEEIVLTKL